MYISISADLFSITPTATVRQVIPKPYLTLFIVLNCPLPYCYSRVLYADVVAAKCAKC